MKSDGWITRIITANLLILFIFISLCNKVIVFLDNRYYWLADEKQKQKQESGIISVHSVHSVQVQQIQAFCEKNRVQVAFK